jgi:hypothetical protein
LPRPSLIWSPVAPEKLAAALAAFGYSPFAHLQTGGKPMNPAMAVVGALAHADLDVRLVESLPWVLSQFEDLDSSWLVAQCRLLNLQNRLGYLVTLAGREQGHLQAMLAELERSRLAAESTLCRDFMPPAERAWVSEASPTRGRALGSVDNAHARPVAVCGIAFRPNRGSPS